MKTSYTFFAIVFVLCSQLLSAQNMNWQWAQGSTAGSYVEVYDVTADRSGNAILAGWTENDSVSFGLYTVHNVGATTTNFLVKYSPAGQVQWAFTQPGSNDLNFSTVASDTFGNAFTFGFSPLTAAYFMKVSSAGNLLWIDSSSLPGQVYSTSASDVATDLTGNSYFTGAFRDSIVIFGHDTLRGHVPVTQSTSYFLVKYDPSGTLLWSATASAGMASSGGGALATDMSNNLIVGGYFMGDTLSIGVLHLHAPSAHYNNFVAKYDAGGTVLWANALTSSGANVCTDPWGNIYVSGIFGDTLFLNNTIVMTRPAGETDLFIIKLDPSGHLLWCKASYETNVGGNATINPYAITCDKNGHVYISGGEIDTMYWPNDSIVYSPSASLTLNDRSFILSLDTAGHIACAQIFPLGGDDANGLAADPFGNVYWAGDYMDSAFTLGTNTLRGGGFENAFLGKFSDCIETKTGINDIITKPNFTLRPNPGNGIATVSFKLPDGSTDASLHITDMMGKEIKSYAVQNSQTEIQVDVHEMSSGIYIVSLMTDGRIVATQKMVVE